MSRKIYSLLIAIVGIFLLSIGCFASESASLSQNVHKNTYDRWTNLVTSELYQEKDNVVRAEYIASANGVVVETYNQSFKLLSKKIVAKELSMYGGMFIGEQYNFIFWGNENKSENDNAEIIRVVKYTKDWSRISSCSFYGENTTVPFDAGRVSAVEHNGLLFVRTAHEMYMAPDGKNHQANVSFIIEEKTMACTDKHFEVSNSAEGYVSHSFNQFLAKDGSNLISVDHGDAHPRTLVLMKYSSQLASRTMVRPQNITVCNIDGVEGDNDTGMTVGGLEVSVGNYLVAYSSKQQGQNNEHRNIYIGVVDKNSSRVNNVKITNYASDSNVEGTPHLVKINDNKFLVMWESMKLSNSQYPWMLAVPTGTVSFVFIDGNGKPITGIYTSTGSLSDCKPILSSGSFLWYVTDNSVPVFCFIPASSPTSIYMTNCPHAPKKGAGAMDTCSGTYSKLVPCSICGCIFDCSNATSGHRDSDYDNVCDICHFPMPTQNPSASAKTEKAYYKPSENTVRIVVEGGNASKVKLAKSFDIEL